MTAQTPAQRKAAERERMRSAGYILRQIWVRPEKWPEVRDYVERVNGEATD